MKKKGNLTLVSIALVAVLIGIVSRPLAPPVPFSTCIIRACLSSK